MHSVDSLFLLLDVAAMKANRKYNRVSAVAVARIISLTHLELANITGTMVWVDFLSTLEVNLGIICVSLPMLGPLVTRWHKTRGASKIGNYNQSERSGQSGSKLSSRKRQPGPDTIALHSIYDNADDTAHVATAFVPEEQSPNASETNLSPQRHLPRWIALEQTALSSRADGRSSALEMVFSSSPSSNCSVYWMLYCSEAVIHK